MPLRRAPYTPCKIYYDAIAVVEPGHYVRTSGGSGYLVTAVRINRNNKHRKHLTCLRWPVNEIPADARVHELHWYRREKRSRRIR